MGTLRHAPAPDVAAQIARITEVLDFAHIDPARVHCRRSWGSTADAYARIWDLPRMWQEALDVPPQYVLEVLSEHFDVLSPEEQLKTLIHELLHIPRSFSGALRGHRGQGERIDGRTVNKYYRRFCRVLAAREAASAPGDGVQLALPLPVVEPS
jgi:predicted metallopeptidase